MIARNKQLSVSLKNKKMAHSSFRPTDARTSTGYSVKGDCMWSLMAHNGSGIAAGRDLKNNSFNLAQMPNRSTND